MKHLITLLTVTLLLSLTAPGQLQKATLQSGAQTNSPVRYGTNLVYALNQIPGYAAGGSLDFGVSTNLGVVLRGQAIPVTASTVGVGIAGSGSSAITTNAVTYTFERSWDAVNWLSWTNAAVTPDGTNRVYTNFVFSLGDWHYIRVRQITNANISGTWRSNFLEFYWKQ